LTIREIVILALSRMDLEISMACTFGETGIFMTDIGRVIIKMDMEHSIIMLRESHTLDFGRKIRSISLIIKKKRKVKKSMGFWRRDFMIKLGIRLIPYI